MVQQVQKDCHNRTKSTTLSNGVALLLSQVQLHHMGLESHAGKDGMLSWGLHFTWPWALPPQLLAFAVQLAVLYSEVHHINWCHGFSTVQLAVLYYMSTRAAELGRMLGLYGMGLKLDVGRLEISDMMWGLYDLAIFHQSD